MSEFRKALSESYAEARKAARVQFDRQLTATIGMILVLIDDFEQMVNDTIITKIHADHNSQDPFTKDSLSILVESSNLPAKRKVITKLARKTSPSLKKFNKALSDINEFRNDLAHPSELRKANVILFKGQNFYSEKGTKAFIETMKNGFESLRELFPETKAYLDKLAYLQALKELSKEIDATKS